ncbi:MAG: hypothetical protein DMF70_01990 [Acidobacteria bacterium]|nr:MAG: hypothetical protein DMF70_01990 [Acidobacteriota bacterium]
MATRDPSGESLERNVVTRCRFPDVFELLCAGLLCATTSATPNSKAAPHLKASKACARKDEW